MNKYIVTFIIIDNKAYHKPYVVIYTLDGKTTNVICQDETEAIQKYKRLVELHIKNPIKP